MDPYALITGATEGLGKNFVLECAKRNMHIIAVALPGKELDAMKRFVERNFSVRCIGIGADLTTEDACKYVRDRVREMGIRINMLVNCAGISLTHPFHEMTEEQCSAMVRLNILGLTFMTRYFIDDLLDTTPSYMINVSSLSAYFHLPNKQVYGASKAYVYSFSRGLQAEYHHRGIQITVVCPGGLNSNVRSVLANNQGGWVARQSITSPEHVAAAAVRAVFRKKPVVVPGRINKFFLLLNYLLTDKAKAIITSFQMNKLMGKEKNRAVKKVRTEQPVEQI